MSLSEQDRALIERVTGVALNPHASVAREFALTLGDLYRLIDAARAEGARLEPTEDQLRAGAGELARLAEHPDDLDIARCVYLAVRDGDRQKGSAERDGGAGVPVRSLSAQATDKSDRAEGVAALQQAGEPVAWRLDDGSAGTVFYTDKSEALAGVKVFGGTLQPLSPLPQQTALVEEGLGPHEPAACGKGTLPSPSVPPRSTGGAMGHLGNVLQLFAELDPGDRCRAFDNAMDFYNEHNPERRVEGVPGFVTHLTIESPLTRADQGGG